jgi:altronate dehydratase large subunit
MSLGDRGAQRDTFWGYRREDGTVGVRNHLVVVPSVICANTVAQRIATLIPGAVALPHPHGCAQVGDDVLLTEKVLAGSAANPNVGAALIVGLGCETCQASQVADLARAQAPGRPMESFYIQDAGGSVKAIAKGVELGKDLMARIAAQRREPVSLSELVVATQCSGLDRSSVHASNPTVGAVADRVVEAGGTVLFSQTSQLIEAEAALAGRAASPSVAERLRALLSGASREVEHARRKGADHSGSVLDHVALGGIDHPAPAAGSEPDGTLPGSEASLSCAAESGSHPLDGVLGFADRPQGRGVYLMDGPAHETVAVSAMVAGGAQICLCTTGRGSPLGNALSPVIKVCGNASTLERMADNVDFSTLAVMSGETSARSLGDGLFDRLLDVCDGQLTNAELIGHQEFAIHRIGPTV